MDALALIIGLLVGIVIGALAGAAAALLRSARRRAEVESRLAAAEARAEGLAGQLERADAALAVERAQARDDLERQRQLEGGESRVLTALAPVQRQLESMQRAVAAIEEQRSQQYGELSEQLRLQRELDEGLRLTTEGLASALRSNSARGAWGEAQLRNIVEAAGMLERVDFETQVQVATEHGARRPDMIVHLPGDATVAIDAKAPMTKYLEASELAGSAADAERREALLAQHAKHLRGHVQALADRSYASAFTHSPQLVIAFVPSESALSAALAADPSLLDDAFAKGIAVTSPVSLWAVLKAIAASWQHERLSESADEVIELGKQLAARLGTAAGHLDKLGRSLTATVGAYNSYVGSVETRVLPTARRLAEHAATDAPASPRRLDEHPRALTAPELTERELTEPELTEPELTEPTPDTVSPQASAPPHARASA